MARPFKQGLDYFSHDTDTDNDRKIKLIMGKYGLTGYGLYMKLLETGYRDNGYFIDASEDNLTIIGLEVKLEIGLLREIIEFMLYKNLFDLDLFSRYKILTSRRMQKNYLLGTERRSKVALFGDYLLINVQTEKGKNHKADFQILSLCTTETPKKGKETDLLYNTGTQIEIEIEIEKKEREKTITPPAPDNPSLPKIPIDIDQLMQRTFGRNPKEPERELTERLLKKFGMGKLFQIYKNASLKGFKNLGTLEESLLDDGNFKPKNGNNYQEKLSNSSYSPANFKKKSDKSLCENDCGKEARGKLGEDSRRMFNVCSRKCYEEIKRKNENSFASIAQLLTQIDNTSDSDEQIKSI